MTKGKVVYCPQELVIHSTIHKHITGDTSDNMLSVWLSATKTNASAAIARGHVFFVIHLYVKTAIYIHLPGRCVRWHTANLV